MIWSCLLYTLTLPTIRLVGVMVVGGVFNKKTLIHIGRCHRDINVDNTRILC